jgi:macrodomain Ter protein organizer (MatP/YcbG family)
MARERYRVTKRDRSMVASYIERKLATDAYWVESEAARREFQGLSRDEVALNGWCEKWLSGEQWGQLKDSLRAARKRVADQTGDRNPPVHVTLSRSAWMMLRDLAKRDGVTLSEFLEGRLRDEWRETERL